MCHWYLTNTHWQTTEYRATQLLLSIKFKLSHAIFWFSLSSIECPLVFNAVSVTIGIEVAVLKNSPSPSTSKSVLMLNPINSSSPPLALCEILNPDTSNASLPKRPWFPWITHNYYCCSMMRRIEWRLTNPWNVSHPTGRRCLLSANPKSLQRPTSSFFLNCQNVNDFSFYNNLETIQVITNLTVTIFCVLHFKPADIGVALAFHKHCIS